MVVQHNMTALNANRYLGMNNTKLGKSLEKLSSGFAINRAGDNAAGLAVSEKMRSQINGMTQGVKNAQDGISMIQTYEGALTETDSILQRMKTLATQAANGTYDNGVDRSAIQLEYDQLKDELNQIADTDFNGVVLLNGGSMADGTKITDGKVTYDGKADNSKNQDLTKIGNGQGTVSVSDAYGQGSVDLTKPTGVNYEGANNAKLNNSIILQVGARSKDAVEFNFDYSYLGKGTNAPLDEDLKNLIITDKKGALDCTVNGLGLEDTKLTSQEDANAAIDQIDTAINKVSMVRATFGSVQNRLEHKIDNMNVTVENLTSAESRIRDTDMATEMMNFTKQNILAQASQSMLAQANQLPQSVLSLLQ